MSIVSSEEVLVVPAQLLHRLGYFQGFQRETDRYLPELLRPEHICFRPRASVEHDPDFKQLIPYVIFRHCDSAGRPSLFQYTRGTGQGEGRLHRKKSVGVGGHIASSDALRRDSAHPYEDGMWRELREEVAIETACRQSCVGLINDDQTEVGRVHLGLVHLCDVTHPAVRPRETEIVDAGFRPLQQIIGQLEAFESWSQICLQALFASGP